MLTPGAVPQLFGIASAPSGTSACLRFISAMGMRRASNIARIASSDAGSRHIPRLHASAIASRVRSSEVGPRPPHRTTTSARSRARRMHATIRSWLSPTVVR